MNTRKGRAGSELVRWQTAGLLAALVLMLLLTRVRPANVARAGKDVAASDGVPTLTIDVAAQDFESILARRDEALRVGILLASDEDSVAATLRYEDEEPVSAWVRLAGPQTTHLTGDKWSYAVQVRDGDQVDGLRRFSIRVPTDGNWLDEWGYHQTLMDEGLLATRISFVNVTLNGETMGVYALEEDFSEELLEAQGRRQGVIIRLDDDLFWRNRATLAAEGLDLPLDAERMGALVVADAQSADVEAMREGYLARRSDLSAEAGAALSLLRAFQSGERAASEVFDVDLMGRYFALSDLWGAGHATLWQNLLFHYNPITARLEPIGFDGRPFDPAWAGGAAQAFRDEAFFGDPLIRIAYAQELERVTRPAFLSSLKGALGSDLEAHQGTLQAEVGPDALTPPWEQIEARQQLLQAQLGPAGAVRGAYTLDETTLQVDVVNLMILPVEVVGLKVGDWGVSLQPSWMTPESEAHLMPDRQALTLLPVDRGPQQPGERAEYVFDAVHFDVPLAALPARAVPTGEDAPDLQVSVVLRVAGLRQEASVPLSAGIVQPLLAGPTPQPTTVEEVLSQHGFLSAASGGGALVVQPGEWDVAGDLVLPEGMELVIPPGTTLRFESGAVLYSTGPLTLLGSEDGPVSLTAQEEGWGGVVVIGAGAESVWQYATVEKTQGILRGGWILTGAITFYESPLTLDHVRLLHSEAEDAINVVRGPFEFRTSEFGYAASDAFDGDFAAGRIIDSSFHDIGGDAIDIGGSDLTLSNVRVVNVEDKALSIGERSVVSGTDLDIANVGFGVVSKDLSHVTVARVSIANAANAGLSAYIKKAEYGPATIEATDVTVVGSETLALVQTGSTVTVDGVAQETVDVDVDALY